MLPFAHMASWRCMKLTFFDEVLFVSHSVQSEINDTINNNNNNNKLLSLLIDKMFKISVTWRHPLA